MRQVLIYIPLYWLGQLLPESIGHYIPDYLPLYGYGMMLFLAFVLCSWLAGRLATREGIDRKILPDLAIWLFVSGIFGARITYVIQERPDLGGNPLRILALWDGGLILYGSIIGGVIGYFLAHRRFIAPAGISAWKMMDVIAPGIALGVALGRVGCLLTGCCYGNVACSSCPAITFPAPSAPTLEMDRLGYQALGGFIVDRGTLEVLKVEPDSPAESAGLKPHDTIIKVNGTDVSSDRQEKDKDGNEIWIARYDLFRTALLSGAPPGNDPPSFLSVSRNGETVDLTFVPCSLPLHPTQIYETISMCLILFLLLSYYPYKTRDGSVMVLLMFCYGVHRFLNEMLRVDNKPVLFGLTFSQNISILVLCGAGVLAYLVFVRRPAAPKPALPAVKPW